MKHLSLISRSMLAGGLVLAASACSSNPSTSSPETPSTSMAPASACTASSKAATESALDRLNLGDPESEAAHGVSFADAPVMGDDYPEFFVTSVRSSSFLEGHEPYLAVDGDPETSWQTVGKPPFPMVRGQFVEIEINQPAVITDVSVRFIGDGPQNIKLYSYNFSDHRKLELEAVSSGSTEMETFSFEGGVETRAVRIEYAPAEDGSPQGIAEVRFDQVPFPGGYPLAHELKAPIDQIERAFYVEFQRFFKWPIYNLKRSLADGGTARVLMPTDEFEGGHVEFDLAVTPEGSNLVTLKTWASRDDALSADNNAIALQLVVDDPIYNGRWYLPAYVTRHQVQLREWYGNKPTPGHWAFATYQLPEAVTQGESKIRLRLLGIGNGRRDHPMREPAPPIYEIISHTPPPFLAPAP